MLPESNFVRVKLMHVVVLHPLQYRVGKIVGLYQHTAITIHPAGTAAHLLHKLERPFVYPEVGEAQQAIGTEYAH